MPRFTGDTPRIAFDDVGTGDDALLFLPGWCANRSVFRPVLDALRNRQRSLALDWRGHGASDGVEEDFSAEALLTDALRVIEAANVRTIVPVALAHAGWIAIELAGRLGKRVPRMVLVDWIVTPAPPPFLDALRGMQEQDRWEATVHGVFDMWLAGTDNQELTHFVRSEMGSYGFPMWSRGAREIAASYSAHGSPLAALSTLPSRPVLHLFSDSYPPGFTDAQRTFADSNGWYSFETLPAKSHFPTFEVADRMAASILGFVKAR